MNPTLDFAGLVAILDTLGWALLHSTWQGAVITLGVAAALSVIHQRATSLRYAVACLGLAAMLVLPVGTAWRTLAAAPAQAAGPEHRLAPEPQAAAAPQPEPAAAASTVTAAPALPASPGLWLLQAQEIARPLLPQIVALWLLGVLLFSLRFLGGWNQVRRLRSRKAAAPAPWQAAVERLTAQLRIRRPVQLLVSASIPGPAAMGWLRPVIVVPASALTGLSIQQMESILAHELAHIRRHDYLVNLLQSVAEILLFYHPAAWWVSRQIRIERENCCDDLAVAVCGDVRVYARALANLEEMRGAQAHRLALAANGGSLLHRIRRLLEVSGGAGGHAASRPLAASGLLLTTVALTAFAVLAYAAPSTARPLQDPAAAPAANAANTGNTANTAPQVSEEEILRLTQALQKAAAPCSERETIRRCVDAGGAIQIECYPENRLFRFWLGLVGREEPLEEEGEPTLILQNQVAELLREKAGRPDVHRQDFPDCRINR